MKIDLKIQGAILGVSAVAFLSLYFCGCFPLEVLVAIIMVWALATATVMVVAAYAGAKGYDAGWDDSVFHHSACMPSPLPFPKEDDMAVTRTMADPNGGGTFTEFLYSLGSEQQAKMRQFDEFGDSKNGRAMD